MPQLQLPNFFPRNFFGGDFFKKILNIPLKKPQE
jgi:hypothetical protein